MDNKIGLFSYLAFSKASLFQAYQLTGLFLCSNKYGLVSFSNLFNLINPNMIVKQKKMDKRVNYKINLDTIYASASSLGISAIKTVRISGNNTKKIFRILTKKKIT